MRYTTEIMGTIDCATGELDGHVTGGAVSFLGFPIAEFSGTLGSGYDGDAPAFVGGAWLLTVPNTGTCAGLWQAALDRDAGGGGARDAAVSPGG